jgi:hypothetical protein
MIKIIHLYDTTGIIKNWHFFIEGIETVLEHAEKDQSIESVLNNLMSGKWFMWTVFIDKKYVGFFVGREDVTPYGEKSFLIVQCYLKKGTPKEAFGEIAKECETLAVKAKYDKVKCYSLRKGMEKKLNMLGYKIGYIEYYKEVGNG